MRHVSPENRRFPGAENFPQLTHPAPVAMVPVPQMALHESFQPQRGDTEVARFVGKCKACAKVLSVLSSARRYHRRIGYMRETPIGVFGEDDRGKTFSVWLTCECDGWVRLWKVLGKYNPEKVCNARCMGATTGACECSCGGKNHGSSHG